MGGQTTVRPAGPADALPIAVLHTTVWREAYRGLVPEAYLDATTTEVRRERWTTRLTTGERRAAVAERAGEVVGAVSWTDRSTPPELASLYVLDGERGTGLAERLVDVAVGDGPAVLWVFEANARARSFYRRLGFSPLGLRQVDPGTGVVEIRLGRP